MKKSVFIPMLSNAFNAYYGNQQHFIKSILCGKSLNSSFETWVSFKRKKKMFCERFSLKASVNNANFLTIFKILYKPATLKHYIPQWFFDNRKSFLSSISFVVKNYVNKKIFAVVVWKLKYLGNINGEFSTIAMNLLGYRSNSCNLTKVMNIAIIIIAIII